MSPFKYLALFILTLSTVIRRTLWSMLYIIHKNLIEKCLYRKHVDLFLKVYRALIKGDIVLCCLFSVSFSNTDFQRQPVVR